MGFYRCLVSDGRGHTAYQILAASGEAEAIRRYNGSGTLLLSLEALARPPASSGASGGRRSRRAVREFTEMMELLLESGLSLKDALELLVRGDRKSGAALLGTRLAEMIRAGTSFAGAVYSMEDTFPAIYRGMVKVGDKVGSVERIFPRLRSYLKDQDTLREKISSALAYPLLVLFLSLAGAAALVFLVMPKLETVFGGFGGDSAEQIHRNIHTIEGILGGFLGAVVLGLLGTAILKYAGKKHPAIREFLDRRILALPLAGQWLRSWESLNFSFAMEVLTGGGVPVEAALTEAAELVSNRAYRGALFRVREAVINGGALSEAFAREGAFPDYLSQWIAIGEGSGKTEKVFTQIRTYFQEEIEQRTGRFLLLIEPALIIAIGIVLLALIIGIILPLFSVYGNIL